jgi:hypothetical protein
MQSKDAVPDDGNTWNLWTEDQITVMAEFLNWLLQKEMNQ